MDSVYVVTRGDFDDFAVVGIFSTRANAKVYLAAATTNQCRYAPRFNEIEKWPLDPQFKDG